MPMPTSTKICLAAPGTKTRRPNRARIVDYVDNERRLVANSTFGARRIRQSEVRLALGAGVTHIRTHVDIDTDAGLPHFEGIMATRDKFKDALTMQLVAFPRAACWCAQGRWNYWKRQSS